MGKLKSMTNLVPVGHVVHIAKSGRLIVKLSRKVRDGTFLLDEKGTIVGRVLELIGPVSAPYAVAAPSMVRMKRIVEKVVYVGEAAAH